MGDRVKLDKPAARLDQVRFEEQPKEGGVLEKNKDGFITKDEVDAERVPGGFGEVKRAAGQDGLLQPSEVAGINIERTTMGAALGTVGFAQETRATKSVKQATEEILQATQKMLALGKSPSVDAYIAAVSQLSDAAEAIREDGTRTNVGLADESATREVSRAFRALSRAAELMEDSVLRPVPGTREVKLELWQWDELKKFNGTFRDIHQAASNTFGLSFPLIQLRQGEGGTIVAQREQAPWGRSC